MPTPQGDRVPQASENDETQPAPSHQGQKQSQKQGSIADKLLHEDQSQGPNEPLDDSGNK
jgi:hypothetical protein